MKRSDMIKVLTTAILDNIQLADVIDDEEVSNILGVLETAGMLPPSKSITYDEIVDLECIKPHYRYQMLYIWEEE